MSYKMKSHTIEYTLYLSEFLTSLSFTISASFYPGLEEEKGISLWVIGLILVSIHLSAFQHL